ncbi:MAG: CBS domain-containing protein, partial [Gammaproteobacteria bacterium]
MKVCHVLSIKGSNVVSVAAEATVRTTLQLFAQKKIGGVTVTDAVGQAIGLGSQRDICNAIAEAGECSVRAPTVPFHEWPWEEYNGITLANQS